MVFKRGYRSYTELYRNAHFSLKDPVAKCQFTSLVLINFPLNKGQFFTFSRLIFLFVHSIWLKRNVFATQFKIERIDKDKYHEQMIS